MKKILFIISAIGLLLLIFSHPALVAEGCTRGLTLWYTSVLPSLLPFFIISNLLIHTGLFHYLNYVYAPVLKRVFRISDEGCYAVLVGFLCGFPMGAKVTADLTKDGLISQQEGTYLLGFCNNVSPAFFLNYILIKKLAFPEIPWGLFTLFYTLPVLYGLASRGFYHFTSMKRPIDPKTKKQASLHRLTFPMLDTCIMDGFGTITRLGGYIMIFTIMIQFLRLLPVSDAPLALASAILEISSGIDCIACLPGLSQSLRVALSCMAASFGGLCICAQTASVLEGSGLKLRSWLTGRAVITFLLAVFLSLPAAAA